MQRLTATLCELALFLQFFNAHLPNPHTPLNMDTDLVDAIALVHNELENGAPSLAHAFAQAAVNHPHRQNDLQHMGHQFLLFAANPTKFEPLLSVDPRWQSPAPRA